MRGESELSGMIRPRLTSDLTLRPFRCRVKELVDWSVEFDFLLVAVVLVLLVNTASAGNRFVCQYTRQYTHTHEAQQHLKYL